MDLPKNLHLIPQTTSVRALITTLRDKSTRSQEFRHNASRLGELLAAQVLANQPVHTAAFALSPTGECTDAAVLKGSQALVPILRAGQALVGPFERFMSDPSIWHVGVSRGHETLKPTQYFCAVPEKIVAVIDHPGFLDTHCYVLDPMLATGGSAEYVVRLLKARGAKRITFAGIIGAPEGVKFLHEQHPDVDIYLAVLDRCLNEKGYILPGLGDFGDRYFNSGPLL